MKPMSIAEILLRRSLRLVDVAEKLYCCATLSPDSKLSDLSPQERAVYLQQAEQAWAALQQRKLPSKELTS